ncbi:efflux RND transporter permease subunit [Ferrimonas aestuarii]|uniref:Efflux RND transporter permease subunit n=1 Tax=Ferrimonas aestuarii TaxID=2569539 RepID=A0A4U1BG81_9GAMM|nr:efflux RND transporter permease subunit [Ferrimonas aestuarii]TKB50174.1 efflux RND transporter permease subunit [Ferrimonas aestuarii]
MIAFFSRHPTAANLLMAGLLLVGIQALPQIKRETFPEFDPNYISASIAYPGASPSEVEESLCLRMEDAVDGIGDIIETKCQALEGTASMILKLDDKADLSRNLVDVQTQINAIKDFPADIEPPVVQQFERIEPVIDIAVSADMSQPALKAYAEDLKRRLKLDTGVALVEIKGFSDHQLRIELNQARVRQLGLSVADIANQVSQQNIQLPSGSIETEQKNLLIRFDQRQVTPKGLGELVVASDSSGAVVRLKEIATITDRFELDEAKIEFDGHAAAILTVSKNKAEDALTIKDEVVSFIEAERQRLPDTVTLTLTNDFSSLLWDRLSMIIDNGIQGIILVFLVMWLFFSLRYSFWVAAGLPVAFLGSIYLMGLFGISINIMTLVALLMAIGIMMDDAIVLAESIAAHLDRGMELDDAVIQGVQKVMPGVFSSFLTTICIFGGLLFLDGQMGAVLSAIPAVLIMVLSLSLIEAFLILPNHLRHSLHKRRDETPDPKFKRVFLQKFEQFRNDTLVPAVRTVVRWRYAFVGGVLGLLLASFALLAGGAVKFIGFPDLDGDVAEARLILPPGSTLSQTEAVVARIIDAAETVGAEFTQDLEDGQPLVEHITVHYNSNADAGESGPHVATVRLDLLSAEVRETRMDDFLYRWREQSGEMAMPLALSFQQPAMGPGGRDLELRIQGDDLDELKQVSVAIQQYLAQFDGITGLLDDMRPGKEEIKVSLRSGAESFGVTGNQIASQLRAAFFGQNADIVQVGPENIEIQVRLDKRQAGDIDALSRFPIVMADGSQIPLASVAQIEFQRSFVRIQRINGLRTITVMGNVDNQRANTAEVLAQFNREYWPTLKQQFPGVRLVVEGASKDSAETADSMKRSFIIGMFGIFAILSFQFRSYQEPLVVMSAIPLALIGVIWGHLLLGKDLSMPSMLGFVSLAGVVVNDSILLVQYIRHHLKLGEPILEAVVQASRERFRAVFLTSLTTAAGLLPLLLETSLQAQVVIPIVISIVFGIFASTLLVLFVIPAAYAILSDLGWVRKAD